MKSQHLTHRIKAVKNSAFIREGDGDYVALHYDSEIFRAHRLIDKVGAIVTNLYVPSVTSSKMAKRCFEYVFGYIPESKEWKELKERFNQ